MSKLRDEQVPAVILSGGSIVECERLWVMDRSGWVAGIPVEEPDRVLRFPPDKVRRAVEHPNHAGRKGGI